MINEDEVRILYHFFSRVKDRNSWLEIMKDLGYTHFWSECILEILYFYVNRSKHKDNELKFYMQFIAFYWDNLTESKNNNDTMEDVQQKLNQNLTLIPFFKSSLSKAVKVMWFFFCCGSISFHFSVCICICFRE